MNVGVWRWLGVIVALSLLVGGCGSPGAPPQTQADALPTALRIATTVSPITNIVANVAGDRAEIIGIIPEGTNSHTFEPPPSAAEVLATVDLIFMNGLGLEDPTQRLAEQNMKGGAELIKLGDRVLSEDEYLYDFSFPKEEGKPNPHTWTSPRYAVEYAGVVRQVLSERDPDNAGYYEQNFQEFQALFEQFDAAMREAFATIPKQNRKLLTYHDSFAYFARDYEGWQLIGAIQVSDFSDPSPRKVAEFIDQIRREGVPAIFGSEVFPSPVLERIAVETGADYVDDLLDDDLPGEPGARDHSLIGLLRFDFATITQALGGDPTALRDFPVGNVAPDQAEYPQ